MDDSAVISGNQTPQTGQTPPPSAPAVAVGFGGAQQTSQAPQQVSGQADQTAVPQPQVSVAPKMKEQAPPAGGEKIAGIDVAEADKVAREEGDEYWENYAREIELEKEILEMGGVAKVESGEVKVPEKLASEMGIKPTTNIQTPITNVTDFSIRGVSLSDGVLSAGIVKPTSSGIRWLVEWFIYQLLKAHFHIKRIKGRIFRERIA